MKLSALESSILEREAGWREGGVPAEQLGQGTQLQTLQGERESLLKEVRELQNRMKSESFLSLEEERRWVVGGKVGGGWGQSHSGIRPAQSTVPRGLCSTMYIHILHMYVCMYVRLYTPMLVQCTCLYAQGFSLV